MQPLPPDSVMSLDCTPRCGFITSSLELMPPGTSVNHSVATSTFRKVNRLSLASCWRLHGATRLLQPCRILSTLKDEGAPWLGWCGQTQIQPHVQRKPIAMSTLPYPSIASTISFKKPSYPRDYAFSEISYKRPPSSHAVPCNFKVSHRGRASYPRLRCSHASEQSEDPCIPASEPSNCKQLPERQHLSCLFEALGLS